MSAKFYGFLWTVVAVSAGILWLGNVFTMLAVVIFGFIAFGLVFTGMMCVLPATVSQASSSKLRMPLPEKELDPTVRPVEAHKGGVHFPVGLRTHRTARS